MLRNLLRAALVVGVFSAGAAQAQEMRGGMHGHMRHGEAGYLGFLHGITLTSDQQSQVHAIMHAAWQQMKPQAQQLRSLHEQISNAMASNAALDTTKIATLEQQSEAIRSQLDEAKLATALQVRGLLTPQQLAQSASIHQQMATLHQQERALMAQTQPTAQ